MCKQPVLFIYSTQCDKSVSVLKMSLSRSGLFLTIFVLSVTDVVLCETELNPQVVQRPNIIIIVADDLVIDHFSTYTAMFIPSFVSRVGTTSVTMIQYIKFRLRTSTPSV